MPRILHLQPPDQRRDTPHTPPDPRTHQLNSYDWLRQAIGDLIAYEYDSGILPWP